MVAAGWHFLAEVLMQAGSVEQPGHHGATHKPITHTDFFKPSLATPQDMLSAVSAGSYP